MSACKTAPECPADESEYFIPVFTMDCETGEIDLAIDNCEAKTDCQIVSQIIMALYIKGRDNNYNAACRGGWFGGDIGSRLWTLEGQRLTSGTQDDVVRSAEQYLEEALQSLVSDGIIDDVTVNASTDGKSIVIDDIIIKQPGQNNNYSYLWEAGCA